MCRLFGAVSHGPVYYDLFEEFADLAVMGNTPRGGPDERGHRDGWGIAFFRNGAMVEHARGVGSAQSDPRYLQAAWKVAKANIDRKAGERIVVLAHIRRASPNTPVGVEWSHPFVEERDGATWAFVHNGSLSRGGDADRIDSQVLFGLLLDALRGRDHAAVAEAAREARDRAIRDHGGFTSLSFLLTDGVALHAYRDFQANGNYYTLYQDHLGEMIVTASEPILGMADEPLPRGVLHSVTPTLEVQRTTIA